MSPWSLSATPFLLWLCYYCALSDFLCLPTTSSVPRVLPPLALFLPLWMGRDCDTTVQLCMGAASGPWNGAGTIVTLSSSRPPTQRP